MRTVFAISAFLAIAPVGMAQSIAGMWQATITNNQLVVPFRIQFQGDGDNIKGTLFNGNDKFTSTSGHYEKRLTGSRMQDYYGSEARSHAEEDQTLEGKYIRNARSSSPFRGGTLRRAPLRLPQASPRSMGLHG